MRQRFCALVALLFAHPAAAQTLGTPVPNAPITAPTTIGLRASGKPVQIDIEIPQVGGRVRVNGTQQTCANDPVTGKKGGFNFCTVNTKAGATVTLTAEPAGNADFVAWESPNGIKCGGGGATCAFAAPEPKYAGQDKIVARFQYHGLISKFVIDYADTTAQTKTFLAAPQVSLACPQAEQDPGVLSLPKTCTFYAPPGTTVTLTARANKFGGPITAYTGAGFTGCVEASVANGQATCKLVIPKLGGKVRLQ